MIRVAIIISILFIFSSRLLAVSEQEVKAVFLEKFTHLVSWPKENKKFNICVVNDISFAQELQKLYRYKKFRKSYMNIITLKDNDKIPTCQLLYIGKSTKNPQKIIDKISNRAILSVSDQKKFVPFNIIITIFLENKHFRYIINNRAAKKANINISFLLLKSAKRVIK